MGGAVERSAKSRRYKDLQAGAGKKRSLKRKEESARSPHLSDRDVEALAYFWAIFWGATVLNPRNCRDYRSTMASFGIVEKRGPLRLTAMGKRIIAFVHAPDRPRYPASRSGRARA